MVGQFGFVEVVFIGMSCKVKSVPYYICFYQNEYRRSKCNEMECIGFFGKLLESG
jgi:hypothetical protein